MAASTFLPVWLIVQQQQFVTLQRPWQSCNKGALAGDGYQSKCASLYVWKVNMRVLMSVEFECVGVWVNKSVGARALIVARKSLSVYVRASMEESKRHSQGAVRGEPGCRLITGLQCVWCLPGTDSFSPHGSPLFSPLLYTTLFFSILFLFIPSIHKISSVCLCITLNEKEEWEEAHSHSLGTVWENMENFKIRLCSAGKTHLRVCLWQDKLPFLIKWHFGWHSIELHGREGDGSYASVLRWMSM